MVGTEHAVVKVLYGEIVDVEGLEGAVGHADIDFAALIAHFVEGDGIALIAVFALFFFDEGC